MSLGISTCNEEKKTQGRSLAHRVVYQLVSKFEPKTWILHKDLGRVPSIKHPVPILPLALLSTLTVVHVGSGSAAKLSSTALNCECCSPTDFP